MENICKKPDSDTDKEWREFVAAITQQDRELVEKRLKHFVWQVKRRIRDPNTTEHDMMIVLFGKTGAGKSMAIRKFLSVIDQAGGVWRANFQEIEDVRCSQHFIYSSVAFLDEMEKASRTDITAIKNRISRPYVDYRPMGTNRKEGGPQRTVFIGASNKPLPSIIYDDTGMRRFYEIVCSDKMDWTTINRIDYSLLWRSVDVNAEAPIKHQDGSVDRRLVEQQREYRHISTTEEWIHGIYDTPRPKNDQYRAGSGFADAYIKYKEWEVGRKIDPQYDRKSRNAFFNEITTLASIHSWITVKVSHHKKYLVVARKPADVVVSYLGDDEDDEAEIAEMAL